MECWGVINDQLVDESCVLMQGCARGRIHAVPFSRFFTHLSTAACSLPVYVLMKLDVL
jgi:hypothetical protein